jgi:hypothetical protein
MSIVNSFYFITMMFTKIFLLHGVLKMSYNLRTWSLECCIHAPYLLAVPNFVNQISMVMFNKS